MFNFIVFYHIFEISALITSIEIALQFYSHAVLHRS